jgi:hypothetical protein
MKARFLGALVLAVWFSLPAPSFAQAKPDTSHVRVHRVLIDSMKASLSLTDEQTAKLQAIFKSAHEQALKDREFYKGYRQAMMKAAKERTEKTEKEIMALLTDEQKKKYEKFRKERAAQNQENQKKKKKSRKQEQQTTP